MASALTVLTHSSVAVVDRSRTVYRLKRCPAGWLLSGAGVSKSKPQSEPFLFSFGADNERPAAAAVAVASATVGHKHLAHFYGGIIKRGRWIPS